MNNRRRLVIVLATTASIPHIVLAQVKKPPVLIGWLSTDSRQLSGHYLNAFKEGLATIRWRDGAQCVRQ